MRQRAAAFQKYPNYRVNVAEERQLKADMYQLILPAAGKEAMECRGEVHAGAAELQRFVSPDMVKMKESTRNQISRRRLACFHL